MTDRDVHRTLALVAGLAILAGPRRTRPLAGFLYGVALSRVHGAGRRRLEATIDRLFDERLSVRRYADELGERVEALEARFVVRPLVSEPDPAMDSGAAG